MLVRPVTKNDHGALLTLAREAGFGMTSLPIDADVLEGKIDASVASFGGCPLKPGECRFLWVLEDTATGEVVGSTAIKSGVGLSSPFYSYKLSTITQASRDLGVITQNQVLHMVNDFTGSTEIGTLFLKEDYRRDGLGRFLSRCRFLVLAQFPKLFDSRIVAEMRGIHDDNGNSPFYDHLAGHFFHMKFHEADYIHATKGGQFIADLMPKYPIYVGLLAEEAQKVIGHANEASRPAQAMLEREGFRYSGYVDIFDAGPTLLAELGRISTVARSRSLTVSRVARHIEGARCMIATTEASNILMTLGPVYEEDGQAEVTEETARLLQLSSGDTIRICEA